MSRPPSEVRVRRYRAVLDVYDRMVAGEAVTVTTVCNATGLSRQTSRHVWLHMVERLPERENVIAAPIRREFPPVPEALTKTEARIYRELVAAWPEPIDSAELYGRVHGVRVDPGDAPAMNAHITHMRRKGVAIVHRQGGYVLEASEGEES